VLLLFFFVLKCMVFICKPNEQRSLFVKVVTDLSTDITDLFVRRVVFSCYYTTLQISGNVLAVYSPIIPFLPFHALHHLLTSFSFLSTSIPFICRSLFSGRVVGPLCVCHNKMTFDYTWNAYFVLTLSRSSSMFKVIG